MMTPSEHSCTQLESKFVSRSSDGTETLGSRAESQNCWPNLHIVQFSKARSVAQPRGGCAVIAEVSRWPTVQQSLNQYILLWC